jgi:hypothetical protein
MQLDRAHDLNTVVTPPAYLKRPAHQSSGPLERLTTAATNWTGRNSAFACAMALVIGWLVSGPIFHYSDRWELFINTITSVVTFVMVFVIQRAQNKDTLALQLKVNELIAAQSEEELRAPPQTARRRRGSTSRPRIARRVNWPGSAPTCTCCIWGQPRMIDSGGH